jgi:FixJ family two-component response regulator
MTWGQDLVVVVDDDLAVRESLKFSLELEGFTVRTEPSGRALMASPELWRPLCLVLDHQMPIMDGFEVLERLAARGARPNVILITTHLNADLRTRARAAKVGHVLEKPLSDGALVDTLRQLQGLRRHVGPPA